MWRYGVGAMVLAGCGSAEVPAEAPPTPPAAPTPPADVPPAPLPPGPVTEGPPEGPPPLDATYAYPCDVVVAEAFPGLACRHYGAGEHDRGIDVWTPDVGALRDVEIGDLEPAALGEVAVDAGARLTVAWSPGPSEDPAFTVGGPALAAPVELLGRVLIAPGNGAIYTIAQEDTVHEERRKFVLDGKRLVERTSGLQWVGVRDVAKADVPVFEDAAGKRPLAVVPAGRHLTVLLWSTTAAERAPNALVKTELGLVGWATLDVGMESATIPAVRYLGD